MFKKQTSQLWNTNVDNVKKEMSVWIVQQNYGKQIQKTNVLFVNSLQTPPDTWYKSYDVEMGYIRPPTITDTTTEIDDDNEEHYERGRLSK